MGSNSTTNTARPPSPPSRDPDLIGPDRTNSISALHAVHSVLYFLRSRFTAWKKMQMHSFHFRLFLPFSIYATVGPTQILIGCHCTSVTVVV